MGFFELPDIEPDDDEESDDDGGFDGISAAAWLAGVVPVELVVARSDQAAVVLGGISAYPDGFTLTMTSHLHKSVKRRRVHHMHHPMMWPGPDDSGASVPDELLRFGLVWPDGGRATNLDGWGRRAPAMTEPTHGLEPRGGGGDDREFSQNYWAWPIPGGGPLRVVVEWPAYGIGETEIAIDGGMLAEAAARARPVWPEDAGRPSHITHGSVSRMTARAHGPGSALLQGGGKEPDG